MITGEIRCLPISGRAQGGRDRAPCRREHGAGEEDERVPCGWGRELRQQRSHPGEQKGCWIGRTQHDGSPRQVYSCWEQPARSSRRRGAVMTRDEILQRYRHLRAISIGHHSGAMAFVSKQALLEHAKRLGLATGGMLVAESEAEMTLVFDLALYISKERRSRALDRYARATPLPPGSDAARMLEAMRHARFSVWRITQRHETAGLIITDV